MSQIVSWLLDHYVITLLVMSGLVIFLSILVSYFVTKLAVTKALSRSQVNDVELEELKDKLQKVHVITSRIYKKLEG